MILLTLLCMDEIVTIDTVIAHLSLGLGMKTTLMLSHVPDWRWGFNVFYLHQNRNIAANTIG